jgi:tetratricopeptide (TPR) repeat protein/photosystem II stability/assembly factor-like uncharacterized protein
MSANNGEPDFVVDPYGTVYDARRERYASSQIPPGGPPGDGTDGQSKPPSPQKPKKITYFIPIPIGLILFLIVSLFQHLGRSDTDVNIFDSESAYNAFQSGEYCFFRGEYDEAITHYTRALRLEPDQGNSYNGRGLAYQAQGEHDKALADFDRAVELMPESAMVYNNRALSHYATGDYEHAIADLDEAIVLQDNFGKAYHNRGLAELAMGDYDRAIADLTQAVEFSSDWSSTRPALPTAQRSDPEREPLVNLDAFDAQMRALQIRADMPSALYHRALAYLGKETYDQAIADLDSAIQLRPDWSAAYYTRSLAYLAVGDVDKARADCQMVLDQGTDPELQRSAAEVLALCELGSLGDALPFFIDLAGSGMPGAVAQRTTPTPWVAKTPVVPTVLAPSPTETVHSASPVPTSGALSMPVWASLGLAGGGVTALAIDPQSPATLYAGMSSGGVFKSTDGGQTWVAASTGLDATPICILVLDPTTPTTIYASTERDVYKTIDGSETWVSTDSSFGTASALVIDPVTPTIVYAGGSRGKIYRIIDSGESWNAFNIELVKAGGSESEPRVIALTIDPIKPTTLYAGTHSYTVSGSWRYYPGGVYKSTDGGRNWSQMTSGYTYYWSLVIDPTMPSTLYAGTGNGVYKSTNGGQNWTVVNSGLSHATIHVLVIDPKVPSTVYAGTDGGVYRSIDGGGYWSAINAGLTHTEVRALAIDPMTPSTVYAGTSEGGVFVLRQEDVP